MIRRTISNTTLAEKEDKTDDEYFGDRIINIERDMEHETRYL